MSTNPNLDFEFQLIQDSLKFDYSFTTLIFASLALSLQFSPTMGIFLPWLLVISWFFYLLAALAGGNRIIRREVYYRNNLLRDKARLAGNEQAAIKGDKILEVEAKQILFLFKFRQWTFLLAIFLNFIFITGNYLVKANVVHLSN